MSERSLRRSVLGLAATAVLGLLPLAGASPAAAAGIVPPADPPADIAFHVTPNCSSDCTQTLIADTNYARAKEGLGPLNLPANFTSLSASAQTLVIVNDERVDRGLPAEYGLSKFMDNEATMGVRNGTDPPLQTQGSFETLNGNWYGGSGGYAVPLLANYYFMYMDGYGGPNADCGSPRAAGCWGHRNNILNGDCAHGGTCVMGATEGTASSGPLAGYPSLAEALGVYTKAGPPPANTMDLVASGSEPPPPPPAPTISTFSPASGSTAGGTTVTLNGANFVAGATVTFGQNSATRVSVVSSTQISVVSPPGGGSVRIWVTTNGGRVGSSGTFRYKRPAH